MDSGEEITGLDQGWTFLGAKASELFAGFAVFIVIGEVFFKGRFDTIGMPIMFVCMILTVLALTRLRKSYPDEERGVRNDLMVKLGIIPPGIPAPSYFQPHWSGAPIEELDPNCEFVSLGFDKLFFDSDPNLEEAIIPEHIRKALEEESEIKKKTNNTDKIPVT